MHDAEAAILSDRVPFEIRLAPALLALLFASNGGVPQPPRPTSALVSAVPKPGPEWELLEPGLELGRFSGTPATGDDQIWIVRIDPAHFDLRLVNASAGDSRPRTVRDWVARSSAVAGINASMYQTDGLSSVGLMKTRTHRNNPRKNGRYKAMLAFDPLARGLPVVRILDGACEDVDALSASYGALVQSIRMVSCKRENVWAPDGKRSSTAAIGIDGAGRTLFIHARSPWQVHDLVKTLLAHPIDLQRAMYAEGGPEAQLVVRAGGRELERLGALESRGKDRGGLAWEIPNALVAVRKPR